MRLTPKSVFLGIVVLGLPVAVVAGWSLGVPSTQPTTVAEAPGGAGGLGSAPVVKQPARTTPEGREWSPRPPRPVSVVESVTPPPPSSPAVTATPTTATAKPPAATPSVSSPAAAPTDTLTLPPVPTPTSVETTPTSPEPTDGPSVSDPEPPPTGLGGLRWGRRH